MNNPMRQENRGHFGRINTILTRTRDLKTTIKALENTLFIGLFKAELQRASYIDTILT